MGRVQTVFTDATDGDLAIDVDPLVLASRRRALCPFPWTWLRQVHGAEVVVVTEPGEHAGAEADAAVTAVAGAALAVHTADCAPLLMWSPEGILGAVHAGWRGLYEGVVEQAVAAMEELGATAIEGRLGPTIAPEGYEFGRADLTRMALRFGPEVVAATREGTPALDVPAAVGAVTAVLGVELVGGPPPDTATDGRYFSWRARRDRGRQAAVIWSEP